MKTGDLVIWAQGHCHMPGLVLDKRLSKKLRSSEAAFSPEGYAVLAMLPELGNNPEWFHECELEIFNSLETKCEDR